MDDCDAWIQFPEHRNWFNKLWLADQLGYCAGPCGVPVAKTGQYIIRPIYNLSGMGVGARFKTVEAGDTTSVPPGHFWCERFEGDQLSVTYRYETKWIAVSVWKAFRSYEKLVYRFDKWIRQPVSVAPELPPLFDCLSNVPIINVEFVGGNVIEVHLRESSDPDYDELIPIWANTDTTSTAHIELLKTHTWVPSYDDADGFLGNARLGFLARDI